MAATSSSPGTDLVAGTGPAADVAIAPPSQEDLVSRAKAFLAQEKFNRRFTLPATSTHDELTVTYAVGGVDSDTAPTMLFIGGMFGGRFLASMADHVAQSLGMRFVVTDRPGMGGSTTVDVSLRLAVWLETVPVLLHIIHAQHVSVAAHSCGAIYALNTIYAMPWILAPSHRKIHLFSPWVGPDHAGVMMLSISSYLPSLLVDKFDHIVRLVATTVLSTGHISGMVSGVVSSGAVAAAQGQAGGSGDAGQRSQLLPRHERDEVCLEYCGISAAENATRSKELVRATFAGSTRGASHEALLSLRKESAGSWGACDDYKTYPDMLEAKLREFDQATGPGEGTSTEEPFVRIKTYWADKDEMISKKGEQYFDQCFARFSGTSGESGGGGNERPYLLYESEVIAGTTHDTICLPQYEAMCWALKDARGV